MRNFESENQDYLNIEIPEELDFKVKKALKFGRNKKKSKKIYKNIGIVAALFIAFVGLLNSSKSFYKTIENIPVLSSISRSMTFNWIKASYDKGLVVSDLYKKEKNGITLKIVEVLGDSENLRIGYEIESDKELSYIAFEEVELNLNKNENYKVIGTMIGHYYRGGIDYFYVKRDSSFFSGINKKSLDKNIDFEFKFSYAEEGQEIKDVVFKGKLELNEDMIETNDRIAKVNKNINTNFGEVEILEVKTGLTSTKLLTKLNNNSSNIKFINPRLLTLDGKELDIKLDQNREEIFKGIKTSYFDSGISEDKVIFKADGIKYDINFEQRVTIYTKNQSIKNNNYGAELVSIEGNVVRVNINDMDGLNLVFDDPDLNLIREEKVSILGQSFIALTLELTNPDEEIVSFGTDFDFKSEPIEIELNFETIEE